MNFSEIVPGLYVGSAPSPSDPRLRQFDKLVIAAKEVVVGAHNFGGIYVAKINLEDAGLPPTNTEIAEAVGMAKRVARWIRRGDRVLVTCWMGYNRSALVAGLALLRAYPGLRAGEVIQLIRAARGPNALSNRHFVELLRAYETSRVREDISMVGG
jgi:protein-tyrosine phosphatase